jgi:ATP phosphoribosyltransferase
VVLRIAVPDRGVVADAARSLLDATGYSSSPTSLLAAPTLLDAPVKVFALPERDIPMYAAEGALHLAVTGSLSVDEASVSVPVALELDVGAHELALFSSEPRVRTEGDLQGARIATPWPNLVRRHLATAAIAARRVVPLEPVEHAVALGIADAIAAVVDARAELSGTMRAMRRLGTVRTGHLVVVEGCAPRDDVTRLVRTQVLARLRAAGTATATALLQYDCPTRLVEQTTGLVDSGRPPEVNALASGWSTVRLFVERDRTEGVVERLLDLGCREVITFVPRDHRVGHCEPAEAGRGPSAGSLPSPRGLAPDAVAEAASSARQAGRSGADRSWGSRSAAAARGR